MFKTIGKVFLGLGIGNLTEWAFHKYILHGLGKKKDSIWSFHWHKHHKQCRKTMLDQDYKMGWKFLLQTPEFLVLTIAMWCTYKTLKPISIEVAIGITAYAFLYYFIHMKSHLDQTWAETWIPWHVEHHQKGNQEHSFNVVYPLFDYIFGTYYKPPH